MTVFKLALVFVALDRHYRQILHRPLWTVEL